MLIHGETKSRLYTVWQGIKARCYRENTNSHQNYFDRNICMYEPWINDYESFRDYVTKLPNYGKQGYSLDRIDNDGNYEPNNLRWASYKTQRNNTRFNLLLTYNGKTLTAKQWSEELGIKYTTIVNRKRKGLTDVETLTKPIERHKKVI